MGCLYLVAFPNGKAYIGITAGTAEARFAEHNYNALSGRGRHLIHKALRKYGPLATLRTLVHASDWEYLSEMERRSIAAFGARAPKGYNSTDGGEGALGYKHTQESLKKMGMIHKGQAHHARPHTAQARAKMSKARRGVSLLPLHRERISRALRGNKYNLGNHASAATRAKQSAAHIGVVFSDAHKMNIARAAQAREARRRGTS